jgi:organic hydroperoxide reductase OsmC/OhrA
MTPHFYQVNVSWSKDRQGIMCSPELKESKNNTGGCIEVATPPEFPKGIPGIWSPEHLFTAAVSSCLMTTFLAVAENSKLDFVLFECNSKGKLEEINGKLAMSEVILEPRLVIRHDRDLERAEKILQKAESACLITRSVKSKVSMVPHVTVGS